MIEDCPHAAAMLLRRLCFFIAAGF